jgi:SAM-dependent methyltransferase
MRTLDACDLCGGSDFATLFEGSDQMHPVDGRYQVQQCRTCSLMFLNPQPTEDELAPHYPRETYYSLAERKTRTDRAGELVAKAQGAMKLLVAPLRSLVRSTVTVVGGRLLDVGCGAGQYVQLARELGMDAYGVEPALDRSDDPKIFAGTLADARHPDDFFDVVTVNHVLEHVASPARLLDQLKRVLKPGGTLVVATPLADSLAYRVFGRRWVQLDIPRHLYTFTTSTLRRYADKSGLHVTHVRHNSRPFQFLGSLLYLANDLTGTRRYLARSRFHNHPLLVAATIPLTLATNALGIADQAEVFMSK